MTTVASEVVDLSSVSNTDFLRVLALAAPAGSFMWTNWFAGDPHVGSWFGMGWPAAKGAPSGVDQPHTHTLNTYYSVAALKAADDGKPYRRKAQFERLLALVVDDADLATIDGAPSYILQTSPGKQQIGWLLASDDEDCADIELVTELVTTMAEKGLLSADKSGNNVVRYVRLPKGTNQKPRESGHFGHDLVFWEPENRFNLSDAALAVGIELDELRWNIEQRKRTALESGVTEYQAAKDLGLVPSQAEKMKAATQNILAGSDLHDSINILAGSLVAGGMAGGTVVNHLRTLMETHTVRDERWQSRYEDIPRAVTTAETKFRNERQIGPVPGEDEPFQGRKKKLERVGDPSDGLKAPDWVVDGYLERDSLGMFYGPSTVGKSFVWIDIACSIATGTDWMGNKTRKSAVIYVAGEGRNGMRRRMAAWQKHSGVSLKDAPLFLSRTSVMINDAGNVLDLVEEIDDILLENPGLELGAVVIDTFSRNFEGDENSSKDVYGFINNYSTLIKERYKCHAAFVHHTGHEGGRARGSAGFKQSVDQEFSLEPGSAFGGPRVMKNLKMKDGPKPDDVAYTLEDVHLGESVDHWGKTVQIKSAVPVRVHAKAHVPAKRQGTGIEEICELLDGSCSTQKDLAAQLGLDRKTVMRKLKAAEEAGFIVSSGVGRGLEYTLTSEGRRLSTRGPGAVTMPGTTQV